MASTPPVGRTCLTQCAVRHSPLNQKQCSRDADWNSCVAPCCRNSDEIIDELHLNHNSEFSTWKIKVAQKNQRHVSDCLRQASFLLGCEICAQGASGHPAGLFQKAGKGVPATPHAVIFQTFMEGLQWIGDVLVPPQTIPSERLIQRA